MNPSALPTLAPIDPRRAPQALEAALPALVTMLRECVAQGASIGWPQPPSADEAAAFWRGCAAAVAAGERAWWVALEGGDPAAVVGSAQLGLAAMPNGRHRAEVMKVMVHPRARRRGIAEALMRHAEGEARSRQRSLLVLDTLEDSDAQRLYTRLGWQRCGRIPHYAELGDGSLAATMVMYKALQA